MTSEVVLRAEKEKRKDRALKCEKMRKGEGGGGGGERERDGGRERGGNQSIQRGRSICTLYEN